MRNSKLSEELTLLTTRLMMCGNKREIINLSGEFGKLIEKVIEQEKHTYSPITTSEKTVTATIKFTQKEVATMAKSFKKEFIANGLVARIIKRQSGKRTFLYEIRYRRNGYNISASSTDLQAAKKKFLEMTKPENIGQYYVLGQKNKADPSKKTLRAVGCEWLSSKDGEIDARTYRDYKMNCEKRIFPFIGEKPIADVRTNDIKAIISSAQGRVIETLQTIFKGIMMYALANGDILYNPMQAIKFQKVKRNTRRALTKEEEQTFFERIKLTEFSHYRPFFLLQYYFGLRPVELTDARFEGDFLIALNAKHEDSSGDAVYKKIPIPKQAREKLDITAPIVCTHRTDVLNRIFKRIMQDEDVTQYFLRHTFSTTCRKKVELEIVKIWMGDSPEELVSRVYTHFPDEFMTAQMENVNFFE